jgi:diguanylate cyclase (GGDEF)-like protein
VLAYGQVLVDTLRDGLTAMSFRTRLISFFVVIVLVPMVVMGALVFQLISDSSQGKADARAAGLATAAGSLYQSNATLAREDGLRLAHDPALPVARGADLLRLAGQYGLARVVLSQSGHTVADVGSRDALAPAQVQLTIGSGGTPLTLTVSALPASRYVSGLTGQNAAVVVREGQRTLAQSFDASSQPSFPPRGTVSFDGVGYREVTQEFASFGGAPVSVTTLSATSATSSSLGSSRMLAGLLVAAFLLLALGFAVLSSRALQSQITRFLQAARRLGSGDFSAPVPLVGNDEFAALAQEFNSMSAQLDHRLQELSLERARLRESVRRIGETFAANLDRPALLELALKSAMDATRSTIGRVSVRDSPQDPLAESRREGALDGLEAQFYEAERAALASEELGRSQEGEVEVLAAALRPVRRGSYAHGIVTVARRGRPFGEDEAELLRSLAGQAALALENVELHQQVSRQAVTDDLTGLADHGRFQELLGAEAEQVRRYHHPLGLIMLDLDDFKSINDTYGHQQGDVVLRRVGEAVQEISRETDWPARYGGEELALILPHTDLEGAHAIAERLRMVIQGLEIPRTDGGQPLRVTASVGVAASTAGDKDTLLADADRALYEAKRQGKNRTVQAGSRAANAVGAE